MLSGFLVGFRFAIKISLRLVVWLRAPCCLLSDRSRTLSDSTLAPRRVYAGFWGFDLHPSPLLFFCVAACYWGSCAARRAFALLAKLLLALGLAFWLLAFFLRFLQHSLKLVADAVLQ